MTGPLGYSKLCFPRIPTFIEILGKQNSLFPLGPVIKERHMKEMLYAVRCLKSNEDKILALTGQFKQLSHEPEKFR